MTDLEILKELFNIASLSNSDDCDYNLAPKCFYLNEIGEMAIKNNEEALNFLLEKADDGDPKIRYAVFGFFGKLPKDHPRKKEILEITYKAGRSEKDIYVLKMIDKTIKNAD